MTNEQCTMISDDDLKNLFYLATNGMVVYTTNDNGETFTIKKINPASCKIDKIKAEDVIGKNVVDVFPGIVEFGLLDIIKNVYKTGIPEDFPMKEYKDNRIRGWRENLIYKTKNNEIIAVYIDKTEEKAFETQLLESNQRNEAIIKALPDLFFQVDMKGIFLDCWTSNPELLLSPPDEIIGKNIRDIMPHEIAEMSMLKIKQTLETRELQVFDYELEINGVLKYFEARLVPLNTGSVFILIIVRDVTDRIKANISLMQSEKRYRRLFEAAKDGILLVDEKTGMILDVNPFLVELLGYSHEVFVGKTLWDIGFFKDIVANKENFLELQQKGYMRYEDLPLKTSTGKKIDVEFVSNVYSINAHKIIQCNIRDITDRVKDEQYIKKLAGILDDSPNAIIVHDYNGNLLYVSNRTFSMHGYTKEEFMKLNLNDIVLPDSVARIPERMKLIDKEGEASFEVQHYKKDGSTFYLDIYVKKIDWFGTSAAYSIAVDVTEKRKMTDKLKISEQKFRDIAENISEVVWEINDKQIITFVNRGMTNILGYEPEEMLNKPFTTFLPKDETERYMDIYYRMMKNKDTSIASDITEIITKAGTRKIINVQWKIAFSSDTCHIYMVGHDITEEETRRRSKREHEAKMKDKFRQDLAAISADLKDISNRKGVNTV